MLARNVCNTIFFCWILRGIIIVHFVLSFVPNIFFPFYSCYCISYNNTFESFLDEINFFRTMPKYDVMFIINPICHCSLSKKQCVKICYGIPCQIVMWHLLEIPTWCFLEVFITLNLLFIVIWIILIFWEIALFHFVVVLQLKEATLGSYYFTTYCLFPYTLRMQRRLSVPWEFQWCSQPCIIFHKPYH